MRTLIEFRDGHTEEVRDGMPVCDGEGYTVCFVNRNSGVIVDDMDLRLIARIIFEND